MKDALKWMDRRADVLNELLNVNSMLNHIIYMDS